MFGYKAPGRTTGAVAAGVAIGLLLSACGGSSSSQDSASGEIIEDGALTMGLSAEPANLPAGKDTGQVGYTLNALLHRGLMAYDSDGKLTEGLAESYKVVDPKTYEFDLRPNLEFSDGTALTGSNVEQTLEYLSDPDTAAHAYGGLKDIESVEVSDEDTVVVHLSQPNNAFLQYLAVPTAAIVPPDALTGGVDAWVGAGPFVLEEHNKGTNMILKRNAKYYAADEVPLETLELAFYPDGKARTNALLSGDVDLIDYVPWEDFDRVSSTDGITLDAQDGPFMYLHFNVTDGPVANPLVRQAIAHAINRDNAVAAAFSGHGSPLSGMPVSEDDPNYDEAWSNMWSYDPDRAKELLAEAGYENGLTLSLLTSSQYAFHQDTALSVQADLKAVGINAELNNPDWAARVEQGNAGKYDIAVSGNVGTVTDISYISAFVDGPANYTRSFGYSNAKLNDAFSKAMLTQDPGEQQKFYDQAREIFAEDVPLTTISSRAQGYAYANTVTNFKNLPGFLSFYSGYSLASMAEVSQ
ncbi:ABC transporter substrate-binding protein [Crystallibacter degradans]|uniref:ABC transporter substrate-binding protein n=1 Tax=Crystallibacter degradans TaxID=2726743 RepID=UPI001473282D|nr:ABC transporter substrate-binding protein [Arthrobacter sp. SF27]NMR32245.1 hypothetical protein [Arthrobacter sp. SF27]